MIKTTIRKLPTEGSAQVDTREHILRVALREFAKVGVEGVKLSQIRDLAGQGNRSAVYYHFKTRELLVEAVIERVKGDLAIYTQQALAEEQNAARDMSLDATVERMFTPFLKYFMHHELGAVGLRFLSRLTWQTGAQGQNVLRDYFLEYLKPFEQSLAHVRPDLTAEDLRFKLYLAVNTAIHGLADYTILLADPVLTPLFGRDDWITHLNSLFLGYIKGGLAA